MHQELASYSYRPVAAKFRFGLCLVLGVILIVLEDLAVNREKVILGTINRDRSFRNRYTFLFSYFKFNL